jgi:hypothetical protein
MADDLSKKGPADRNKINVNEEWECKYWCKELDVTEKELKEAVKKVGPTVKDVKKQLGK